MPNEKKETKPGAVDDDAVKRIKKAKKSRQSQLDQLFNDNTTGRYGKGTDS